MFEHQERTLDVLECGESAAHGGEDTGSLWDGDGVGAILTGHEPGSGEEGEIKKKVRVRFEKEAEASWSGDGGDAVEGVAGGWSGIGETQFVGSDRGVHNRGPGCGPEPFGAFESEGGVREAFDGDAEAGGGSIAGDDPEWGAGGGGLGELKLLGPLIEGFAHEILEAVEAVALGEQGGLQGGRAAVGRSAPQVVQLIDHAPGDDGTASGTRGVGDQTRQEVAYGGDGVDEEFGMGDGDRGGVGAELPVERFKALTFRRAEHDGADGSEVVEVVSGLGADWGRILRRAFGE